MARWHYRIEGRTLGPALANEIGDLRRRNEINDDTLVWNDEIGTNWVKLGTVRELTPAVDRSDERGPSETSLRPRHWELLIVGSPILLWAAHIAMSQLLPGAPELASITAVAISGIVTCWLGFKDSQTWLAGKQGATPFWGYMLLSPAGYFLRRRAVTGAPIAPLAWWLAVFLPVVTLLPTTAEGGGESPLQCAFDQGYISCSVIENDVTITDIDLNRGNCPSPLPSEEDKAAVDQYLQSLPTDRDRALAEFAAPMAAPYSEVFGCRTDRDPEFEPNLCRHASAILRVRMDSRGTYDFGGRFNVPVLGCPNLLQYTITANGRSLTWRVN